ncbi:bleomycin resistance protein [Phycisphaerales bacterium AB-hyl4]|uniref:Bleomycin resistance protein n=1 Tax=Natronomicrosphaera hydrolytica TaxID=3242702 RepID=A0ABV4U6A2_9BACT
MKITGAATVLPVRDLEASLRFFIDHLGFAEEFRFGNYAGVQCERLMLHLSQQGNPNTAEPGTGCVYVFCDEVDQWYAQLNAAGVRTDGPPETYPYGMRDFLVFDPDGNQISFGCPVKED